MRQNLRTTRLFALLSLGLLTALAACQPENPYRTGEGTSRGTTYELLAQRGGYDLFLEALDLTGYKRMVDGGGLVTVFAPDDGAFGLYLQETYGTPEPAKVPQEDLNFIVGYHIIQFSYTLMDFLAFSPALATGEAEDQGDGSCYKYKTFARKPLATEIDPATGTPKLIFSREAYLPVISSRLFQSREIPDPQADYLRLFPTGSWNAGQDQLFAGNARVTEAAIPTDNGYLYLVDNVSRPLPTIEEALAKEEAAPYSDFKRIFDSFRIYSYNANLTKSYSPTGDSLFLVNHYKAPAAAPELPEIASQWGYHDDNGVSFEKNLRYAATCIAPTNEAMAAYLKEYFADFGTYLTDDYLSVIPQHALYYFMRSHAFDKQDVILPSQLLANPLMGPGGESYTVSGQELNYVDMCTNGILYGMDKVFEPYLFKSVAQPLLQLSRFSFFSRALGIRNFYQNVVDANNRYTFFVLNDESLGVLSHSSEPKPETFDYVFYDRTKKNPVIGEGTIFEMLNKNFFYGMIPPPSEVGEGIRYYVAKENKVTEKLNYLCSTSDGFMDMANNPINVLESFDCDNGRTYVVDNFFKGTSINLLPLVRTLPELRDFETLCMLCGILNGSGALWSEYKASMVFIPTDEAIARAIEDGTFPPLGDPTFDPETGEPILDANGEPVLDYSRLRQYLLYYFVPLQKNSMDYYMLPGIGFEGMTDQAYEKSLVTFNEYTDEVDKKFVTLSWDPEDSWRMCLTDYSGNKVYTVENGFPSFANNGLVYPVANCFDYRTIFGPEQTAEETAQMGMNVGKNVGKE